MHVAPSEPIEIADEESYSGPLAVNSGWMDRPLPDVLKRTLVQKYLTPRELHAHCECLREVFPPESDERMMVSLALGGAFPEFGDTLERMALKFSVVLRMARHHNKAPLEFVEFFAGDARLTQAMRAVGYASQAVHG